MLLLVRNTLFTPRFFLTTVTHTFLFPRCPMESTRGRSVLPCWQSLWPIRKTTIQWKCHRVECLSQETILGSVLTCVGPSRDLWNVNNAASVQLCAAFLILPGLWGENGGSVRHIYSFRPSLLTSTADPPRSFFCAASEFTPQSSLFLLLLSHGKLRRTFLGRGVVVYLISTACCWGKSNRTTKKSRISPRFESLWGGSSLPSCRRMSRWSRSQSRLQLGRPWDLDTGVS